MNITKILLTISLITFAIYNANSTPIIEEFENSWSEEEKNSAFNRFTIALDELHLGLLKDTKNLIDRANEKLPNSQINYTESLAHSFYQLCYQNPAGSSLSHQKKLIYCLLPLKLRACLTPQLILKRNSDKASPIKTFKNCAKSNLYQYSESVHQAMENIYFAQTEANPYSDYGRSDWPWSDNISDDFRTIADRIFAQITEEALPISLHQEFQLAIQKARQ